MLNQSEQAGDNRFASHHEEAPEPTRASFKDIIDVEPHRAHSAPWNRHLHYSEASLRELGNDMLTRGQLQPILVRHHPTMEGEAFEVVCGERRVRAARLVGIPLLNAHYLEPCDDATARRIRARERLHQQNSDLFQSTIDVLEYLAGEYSSTPGWPQLVEQEGGRLQAAAWVAKKSRDAYPHVAPAVSLMLQVGQDILAAPLRTVFMPGNPHGTLKAFTTNRLPLLQLREDAQQLLREGLIDITIGKAASRLKEPEHIDEFISLARNETVPRSEVLNRVRELLQIAYKEPPVKSRLPRSRDYERIAAKFSKEDQAAAETALRTLQALMAKYAK